MIETFHRTLSLGITLSCRATGVAGQPLLVFLHGFPEGAFVWDEMLLYFARPEHGGYRCVAPNLRGFETSSAPQEVDSYRPKHLVKDVLALADSEAGPNGHMACLIAHDWGGAVAWNFANQFPDKLAKLAIFNSPHPGTFLRELKYNPAQQEASEYMNFLASKGAEDQLVADDFAMLWRFLTTAFVTVSGSAWLTEQLKKRYREVWSHGLRGGCNYYRASPMRPPTKQDPAAAALVLPRAMLDVTVPTMVAWGMQDAALPPDLLDGLEEFVPQLTLHKVPDATHWILHEQPGLCRELLAAHIQSKAQLQ